MEDCQCVPCLAGIDASYLDSLVRRFADDHIAGKHDACTLAQQLSRPPVIASPT